MREEWKGSMTVEAAFLLPMIGMIFFLSVLAVFYYHDKNVVSGCAYEAVVVGSTKAREKDGVTSDTVEAIFYERMENKCILFGTVAATADVEESEVHVEVYAEQKGMKVRIEQSANVTEPETYIRTMRNLKSGLESIGEGK